MRQKLQIRRYVMPKSLAPPPSLRLAALAQGRSGRSLLFGIMASEIIPVLLIRSLALATSHNTEYAKCPFGLSPLRSEPPPATSLIPKPLGEILKNKP